jgi:antitoxin component YwqK of YwqJK toxin-antitoxin module
MNLRILIILSFTIFFSCSSTKEIKENNSSENKLNGITKEFYENGDLKIEWNYKDNLLNGISKEYHKDGTYSEWNYENGQLNQGKSYYKKR